MRPGQFGNAIPNGDHYEPDEVKKMMRQLWTEYIAANSDVYGPGDNPEAASLHYLLA